MSILFEVLRTGGIGICKENKLFDLRTFVNLVKIVKHLVYYKGYRKYLTLSIQIRKLTRS